MKTEENGLNPKSLSASPRLRAALSLFFIAGGFAAIFGLSDFIEQNRPPLPENYADADLALQGAKIKDFSLGFNGLMADFYWMQSLQYVGNKLINTTQKVDIENLRPLNPRLLYPLLDNASDLDPRFIEVYSYGAVVLPAIDSAQAVKLTEKGIRSNPGEWRLYQHLGYIYWKIGDYEKASEVYAEGAKIGGAPPFMKMMSAKMKNEGGSRETSREIYRQMLEQSEDTQIRDIAALRLAELDSFDERDAIRAALENFKTKNNRCANNWREIFPLLQTSKLPGGKDFRIDNAGNVVDPTGAPYILDKENCAVKLDGEKTKLPL
jgi:tetratricopeptide (TPR) repeat protein